LFEDTDFLKQMLAAAGKDGCKLNTDKPLETPMDPKLLNTDTDPDRLLGEIAFWKAYFLLLGADFSTLLELAENDKFQPMIGALVGSNPGALKLWIKKLKESEGTEGKAIGEMVQQAIYILGVDVDVENSGLEKYEE
jgi:hypothetical protein